MGKFFILVWIVLSGLNVWAQDSTNALLQDTSPKKQVVRRNPVRTVIDTVKTDSLTKPVTISFSKRDIISSVASSGGFVKGQPIGQHLYFKFTNPTRYTSTKKQWIGKEALFYSMIGLLIFFALIRSGFHRYVDDLLKSYFRTTVKQRQLKEQLIQSPLPSLLLNVFFVLSIGMFLALLLQYLQMAVDVSFWNLYLYCVLGLLAIYGVKYLSLKLIGWVFQVSEATESYIFIVFTTNKVIGMCLIPFLVVLAFSYGMVSQTAMTLSLVMVAALLVYRFYLSYTSLKGKVRIGFVHFLIYLLAFEIVPLLLINKLLFRFLGETP